MDRRVAGALLLVIALVCTLALPNIVGKRVTGSAVGEVIAGPPAVGSCVTAVTASGVEPGQMNSANADEAMPARALPVATIGPCRGPVVGEVIAVQAADAPVRIPQTHPQFNCRAQVEPYLGTTATAVWSGVAWSKSIYVNAVAVGPDAHDRAAGRTWSACVLSAVGQSYPAPPRLKSSWRTDTLPAVFGLCWAGQVVQHGVPTACTTPHRTQQLAFGFVSSPGFDDTGTPPISTTDPARLLTSCRQLAATIMQTADPGHGGSLVIKVVVDPAGAPYIQCVVSAAGGRLLTGSLIGIGTKPLPLT